MPNRQTTDGNYRYAFQGQEKDPETGMEAFELRLWDGRLGRWLTKDPMGIHHSPYQGMANNPMIVIDPTGGYPTPLEAALMAAFIYGNSNITLIGGWKLSKITSYNRDSDSGLKASLFERKKENGDTEYAYVYAGSVELIDWENNGKQPFGVSLQYAQALEVSDKLSIFLKQKELTFIGHSLGGGLANYSSLATRRRSIAFDPAWLSSGTLAQIDTSKRSAEFNPAVMQTNYIPKGVSLHRVQQGLIPREVKILMESIGENVFVGSMQDHFNTNVLKVHDMNNIIQQIFYQFGNKPDTKAGCDCR